MSLQAQDESTTSGYVPTIDDVVTRAYRLAGLLDPNQAMSQVQGKVGRQALADIVDAVNARGVFCRAVQYEYVALVAGQNQYLMPERVLDVVGNGAFIAPTDSQVPFSAAAELPVLMKVRDEWQGLSAKNAEGPPTLGYLERNAPRPTLFVWPTPTATYAGQIRFQAHVTRPDVTDGNKTLPFERYWSQYFVHKLAAELCMEASGDMGRVSYLAQDAAAYLDTAKSQSRQSVGYQMSISHRTQAVRRHR